MPKKFSWKRATGITKAKQSFARQTGIPTTKGGRQRKFGVSLTNTKSRSQSKPTKAASKAGCGSAAILSAVALVLLLCSVWY